MGLRAVLHQRSRPPGSVSCLATRLQPPPAPHRHRRPPTHQPLDQPVRSVQLAALSTAPPRLLRWAMLGASLVILIAVPLMNLPDGASPGAASTADHRDDTNP